MNHKSFGKDPTDHLVLDHLSAMKRDAYKTYRKLLVCGEEGALINKPIFK